MVLSLEHVVKITLIPEERVTAVGRALALHLISIREGATRVDRIPSSVVRRLGSALWSNE